MRGRQRWLGAAVALLAAASMSSGARAQAALTGLVSSSEEGAMEGVLVSAKKEGSTITTTMVTDEQGRYSFPAARMEAGKYTISIRAIGYKLEGLKTVEVPTGSTATADLKLGKVKSWCRNFPTRNGCSAFRALTSRRPFSRCAWAATRSSAC